MIPETQPMKPEDYGRYVCVAAGRCLYTPHITIYSSGVWVRLPDSLNPGSHIYSSAHLRCWEQAKENQ